MSSDSNNIDTDAENTFPIKFQPMPKRFMVWDKQSKKFIGGLVPINISCQYEDLIWKSHRFPNDFIIVQSTNLFDKDGKEIFEGSIVKWLDSKTGAGLRAGIVKTENGTTFIERSSYDLYPDWEEEKENLILAGHILSTPELLEGNVNK